MSRKRVGGGGGGGTVEGLNNRSAPYRKNVHVHVPRFLLAARLSCIFHQAFSKRKVVTIIVDIKAIKKHRSAECALACI